MNREPERRGRIGGPLGRQEATKGIAIVLSILAFLGLCLALLERAGIKLILFATSSGSMRPLPYTAFDGFRIFCLVAALLCLALWADITSPRGLSEATKLKVRKAADLLLLLAAVSTGIGLSRLLLESIQAFFS